MFCGDPLGGAKNSTIHPGMATPPLSQSIFIGFIGGLVYLGSSKLMLHCLLDDPLDAAPVPRNTEEHPSLTVPTWQVHGACGAWGTIAVGLFANKPFLKGAFYGHPEQLGSQFAGVLIIALWTFATM